MLYSLFGKLILKKTQFAVIEVAGFGLKILISEKTSKNLPKIESEIKFFCFLAIKRGGVDICGFLSEKELEIFELLNSVSGIGPKSALEITGVSNIEKFLAAVSGARADILEKSFGIGKKKAERIVLELKDKLGKFKTIDLKGEALDLDFDNDLKSVLKNLGYKQNEIEEAIKNLPEEPGKLEERLKAALKILNKK
ncbi:MAG: Holliday junction branch migration protein RuvA [Patescibacteria group bacterium]